MVVCDSRSYVRARSGTRATPAALPRTMMYIMTCWKLAKSSCSSLFWSNASLKSGSCCNFAASAGETALSVALRSSRVCSGTPGGDEELLALLLELRAREVRALLGRQVLHR